VPATTRLLLLLAAADDRATLRDVLGAALVAAADGGTIGLDALTPAVAAALITIDRQAIRFRHPLMRSAVYHAADAAARLDAHAALAQVLHEDPDRPAWHHAAAATGPDDGVAAELDEVADRARRRGARDTAIVARERAAMLTVTAAARVRRLLDAAGLAVELGQRDAAHRLLAQVDHRIADPVAAARALWLREMLAHDAATAARQHVPVQAAGVARVRRRRARDRPAVAGGDAVLVVRRTRRRLRRGGGRTRTPCGVVCVRVCRRLRPQILVVGSWDD
jgi:hypothetical protein